VKKEIQSTVNETISAVKSGGAHGGVRVLNHQLTNKGLTATLLNMAEDVGLRFARRQMISFNQQRRQKSFELKGFGSNEEWKRIVNDLLRNFISTTSFSIFETTKDVLITTLNKAIDEGWGVDKTVAALEELDLSSNQAARIVRTEITRAANAGVSAASQTFPFEQVKEWLAAHDDRTRHAHMRLDGVTVNEDDVFIDEDGNELRFPGDPLSAPETTINCRCSMAVVAKVNERNRLIPKKVAA
jgi:uncharacterized protein with gpF-like domain